VASPAKRLAANAPGSFYVDSSCIDCGTCRWMAPASFDALGAYSRVYQQPATPQQRLAALKALVSCPTASIGTADKQGLKAVAAGFPDLVADSVYHCGYHHEDSFGAASYLIVRPGGNVLVDSPRFSRPLVRRMEELGGVDIMFLTHRDDVADHQKFASHFGCRRVLHQDDVGPGTREVEMQWTGTAPVDLADDLTMIPTPGHTRGSACLLFRQTVLFSGDHLAWSRSLGHLYGFSGACWYDWPTQIDSMRALAGYRFEHVLPGHGAPYRGSTTDIASQMQQCITWMQSR
jgi:ferredoxin